MEEFFAGAERAVLIASQRSGAAFYIAARCNGKWSGTDVVSGNSAGLFTFRYFRVLSRRFFNKRDAEDAMKGLDGSRLDGREIRIQLARYARPESGRGGGGGGGDRDGRRDDRRDDRRRDDDEYVTLFGSGLNAV